MYSEYCKFAAKEASAAEETERLAKEASTAEEAKRLAKEAKIAARNAKNMLLTVVKSVINELVSAAEEVERLASAAEEAERRALDTEKAKRLAEDVEEPVKIHCNCSNCHCDEYVNIGDEDTCYNCDHPLSQHLFYP